MKFATPQEVGELYRNREAPVPVLDAVAQAAVRACMETHNFGMVAGSCGDADNLGELIKMNRMNMVHHPLNVIGPYMEDEGRGAYRAEGVGIWGPRSLWWPKQKKQ